MNPPAAIAADDGAAHSSWRLPLGRHRVAVRFALSLIALSFAGPVLQAAADALASVPVVGGLLDGVAVLVASLGTIRTFSGVLCILYLRKIHPAANGSYAATLALTPWHPKRPLPSGDVTITSTFVLLPAVTIALVALVRMPAVALALTYGVVIGYAVTGLIAAIVATLDVVAFLIVMLLILVAPLTYFETTYPLMALALALLMLSSIAHHAAIVRCWTIGTSDFRRFQLVKRSRLGWFDNLPTQRPKRPWAAMVLLPVTVGVLVASIALMSDGTNGYAVKSALTGALFFLAFIRFVYSANLAPFSYGLFARVLTGRIFVPRMDRIFLAPLVLMAWAECVRLTPFPVRSDWNAIAAGAIVAVGGWIAAFVAPTKLHWQILGTSRVALVPTKQQKQQEANLKRWTATTDTASS